MSACESSILTIIKRNSPPFLLFVPLDVAETAGRRSLKGDKHVIEAAKFDNCIVQQLQLSAMQCASLDNTHANCLDVLEKSAQL